jgi:hypothetical protein
MTSAPTGSPDDERPSAADGGEPAPSDETLHVVDTVEVVETNQPMDAWGED